MFDFWHCSALVFDMATATTETKPKRQQPEWKAPEGKERKPLHVYNSLSSSKVKFVPARGNKVSWYICGPTVYDSSHLGHARNYLTFDIIRRILEDYFGYHVEAVMNITDVDDKIILKARRNFLFKKYLSENSSWSDQVRADLREAIDTFIERIRGKIAELRAEGSDKEADLLQESINKTQEADAELKTAESTTTFAAFAPKLQDPLSELLDRRHGSKVTDQQIFRNHAAYYEQEFLEDMLNLGIRMPDVLTRVSEYIPEIVDSTKKIIQNGFAYESNGSVYFDTQAFSTKGHFYAKLEPTSVGNEKLTNEGEGALSSGKQTEKRHANDFALWKKSKDGEPRWDSEFGQGRPGWHIECTAMACSIFGQHLDVHSGGIDLRFPHHDNEIAQAEAQFCSHSWVHYFLHSGHLHIGGLKMAKSLKNFITIRQALEQCTPKQMRYMFLMQPWNNTMNLQFIDDKTKKFDFTAAKSKEKTFVEFFIAAKNIVIEQGFGVDRNQRWGEKELRLYEVLSQTEEDVHNSLADNFDTSSVLNHLSNLVSETNAYIQGNKDRKAFLVRKIAAFVSKILKVFGIQEGDSDLTFHSGAASAGAAEVDRDVILAPYLTALAKFRQDVRAFAIAKKGAGDFLGLCDQFRDEVMIPLGVRLEDAGEFPYKLQDAATLIAEREQAKRKVKEAQLKKKEDLLKNWLAKAKDPKVEFAKFLTETGEFDPKKQGQKKNYDKQVKAFAEYQAKLAAEPDFLDKLKAEVEALKKEIKS